MNLFDYLIILAVALLLFFAVRYLRRVKKQGGCAGCSGCSGRSGCASCPSKNKK